MTWIVIASIIFFGICTCLLAIALCKAAASADRHIREALGEDE